MHSFLLPWQASRYDSRFPPRFREKRKSRTRSRSNFSNFSNSEEDTYIEFPAALAGWKRAGGTEHNAEVFPRTLIANHDNGCYVRNCNCMRSLVVENSRHSVHLGGSFIRDPHSPSSCDVAACTVAKWAPTRDWGRISQNVKRLCATHIFVMDFWCGAAASTLQGGPLSVQHNHVSSCLGVLT